MYRSRSRRAGALLLALWLSVSLVERAVPVRCALHDGGAAPAATHHDGHRDGASGHGSHDGSHSCRCLEQCAASAGFALPGAAPRTPLAAVASVDGGGIPPAPVAPARTDTRLPFANGPPHALSA